MLHLYLNQLKIPTMPLTYLLQFTLFWAPKLGWPIGWLFFWQKFYRCCYLKVSEMRNFWACREPVHEKFKNGASVLRPKIHLMAKRINKSCWKWSKLLFQIVFIFKKSKNGRITGKKTCIFVHYLKNRSIQGFWFLGFIFQISLK